MQSKFDFDRIPRIKFIFNKQNSQKSLGMTGGYDHEGEEIVVYALDRHTKDILRSLAHEMMHHVQKCEGMMDEKDMSWMVYFIPGNIIRFLHLYWNGIVNNHSIIINCNFNYFTSAQFAT